MSTRAIATVVKFAVASLIVGTVLDHFDIRALDLVARLGITPDTALAKLRAGIEWALPTIGVGALVIVPAWLLIALLRPPGPQRD